DPPLGLTFAPVIGPIGGENVTPSGVGQIVRPLSAASG
ncbi:MAG: hypothetical protein JWR27_1919, partial [Aeromicrobium sp.]|nr:hypothetical protein [Aeromicrobium sp.]